jgi:tubulin polyglutamylase TTLL6/13
MSEIARKDTLGRNLHRLQKQFPEEFDFFPKTYVLPSDYGDLRNQFGPDGKSKRIYILKPDASSQGRGIYLTQSLEDIDVSSEMIVQDYIARVGPKKFDLI